MNIIRSPNLERKPPGLYVDADPANNGVCLTIMDKGGLSLSVILPRRAIELLQARLQQLKEGGK